MVFAHLRIIDYFHGSVAQLGERFVRNEEAGVQLPRSILLRSNVSSWFDDAYIHSNHSFTFELRRMYPAKKNVLRSSNTK